MREPHELAVDHVRPRVRQEAHREVGVEVRRLAIGDAEDAASAGLLGLRGREGESNHGEGHEESGREPIRHHWPPSPEGRGQRRKSPGPDQDARVSESMYRC